MKTSFESKVALTAFLALLLISSSALAHGERAQQANLRMRTINWYDIEMSQSKLAVGEVLRLTGHLRPSKYWPEHIPSVTGKVFLNLGTSGPNFIRETSSIDGVSMIQSTSLELGREYAFDIHLKARRPGRFHVHPILSVEGAGTMVGPGLWVEVTGSQDDFVNEVETMFGRKIDLETFNLNVIYTWHAIWFVIGGAWLFYWVRKRPLLIARMRLIEEAESKDGDGDDILTDRDRQVAIGFVVVTFLVIAIGYQWAESRHPITTPLRTAKITVPKKDEPASNIKVSLDEAYYRIPGRSFQMSLTIQNNSKAALTVGEFSTANIRFINPSVQTLAVADDHDLIAPDGLRVEGGSVPAGETRTLKVFAEDALWETQRLTQMINDPDSIIAGLLFFHGTDGGREIVEIGGSMLPIFN
jgi:methane/ammonia monooxygenase subunit B